MKILDLISRVWSQKISTKTNSNNFVKYEGRSESKECFAIQRYLLIVGKKHNSARRSVWV
jgi:hypothetical protein